MSWIIVGLVLLVGNAYFGVTEVKRGEATKSAAFTWFVVGFIACSVLDELVALL